MLSRFSARVNLSHRPKSLLETRERGRGYYAVTNATKRISNDLPKTMSNEIEIQNGGLPAIPFQHFTHAEPLQHESSHEVLARMMNTAWQHMKTNRPEPWHTTRIEITDGPRVARDLIQRVLAQWRDAVIGAADKEVTELNDMERFAIAYFFGVEIESYRDPQLHPLDPMSPLEGPMLRWRTKHRCAIVREGGKFVCYHDGNVRV